MKKILILLLLFSVRLSAQTMLITTNDEYTKTIQFDKSIKIADSLTSRYYCPIKQNYYPYSPRVNTIINYLDTLKRWNGSSWVLIGGSVDTTKTVATGHYATQYDNALKLNKTDTTSLSNRINTKLSKSDTVNRYKVVTRKYSDSVYLKLPITANNQTHSINLSTSTTHNNAGLIDLYNNSTGSITGIYCKNTNTSEGIYGDNSGTGINFFGYNSSTGINFCSNNTSSGISFFTKEIGGTGISFQVVNSSSSVKTQLFPMVADGSTAVGYLYGLQNNLTTAGALHSKWVNSSGTQQMALDKDGILTVNNGIVSTGVPLDSNYIKFKGNYNVNIGKQSGNYNTTGSQNSYIGYQSGQFNTSGGINTGIGYEAGYYNTTGQKNVFIGAYAGATNRIGSYNIYIGNDVQKKKWNSNSILLIDNSNDSLTTFISGDMSVDTLRINADVNIGKGVDKVGFVKGTITANNDVIYSFRHANAHADSINFTSGTGRYHFYKINSSGAFNIVDTNRITIAGDSIKIQTSGDYYLIVSVSATTSNTADYIRIKIFKNNAQFSPMLGRFIINSLGNNNYTTNEKTYYIKNLVAGDYLSVRVSNYTATRAVIVSDYSMNIWKSPEY